MKEKTFITMCAFERSEKGMDFIMDKKEFEEAVQRAIHGRMLELEKEENDEPGSIYREFKNEIRDLGFEFETSSQAEVICRENPKVTRDIVLKYYDKAILKNEKSYLVCCLLSTYNKDLVPFFLKEYLKKEYGNSMTVSIGNFLEINADKKYKEDYISILNIPEEEVKDHKYYIIAVCGKLKLKEAIGPMLNLLKESNKYTNTILKALRKYKDPQFLPVFQKHINDKNSDVRRTCKKGIESIEKVLSKKKKDVN